MNRKFKFLIGCGISTTFILVLGTQLSYQPKSISNVNKNNSLESISNVSNRNLPDNYPNDLDELRKMSPEEISKMSMFDGRDFDIVTSVKDQGTQGICWAFAISSSSETNMLYKENVLDDKIDYTNLLFTPKNVDKTINNRDGTNDPLGLTNDDKIKRNYGNGILDIYAVSTILMQQNAFNGARLSSIVNINNDVNSIKEAIAKYGSVTISFRSKELGNKFYYHTTSGIVDHAVSIIGWQDNINFPSDKYWSPERPVENKTGGWIIKNSWGDKRFDQGYFYLSYESHITNIVAFDYVNKNTYDNIYYYDGMGKTDESPMIGNKKAAAIFPVKKANKDTSEKLKGVSFGIVGQDAKVKATVYKNVDANPINRYSKYNNPESGTKVFEGESEIYSNKNYRGGIYTFDFGKEIELEPNSYFSVVLEPINKDNTARLYFSPENDSKNDLTFYYDKGVWKNCADAEQGYDYVATIKALTVDEPKVSIGNNTDISYSQVTTPNSQIVYDGKKEYDNKPTVKLENNTLIEKTDYTYTNELDFSQDLNDSNIAGTLITIIKGNGKYSGSKTIFTPILKGDNPIIDLGSLGTFDNNKKTVTINVTKSYDNKINTLNDIKLPESIKFSNPNQKNIDMQNQTINTEIIYIKDDKNSYIQTEFKATINVDFKKTTLDEKSFTIENIKDCEYTSNPIVQDITVKYKNETLNLNSDYIIDYSNNINVGIATVNIRGLGYFEGTKEKSFEITKSQNKFIGNLEIVDGHPVIDSKYDDHLIKYRYFKDLECTDEIFEKPTEPGTYYVKAYVEGTQNYDQIESDPVEFKIDSIINGNHQNKPNQEDNTVLVVSITVPIIIVAVASIVTMFFIKRKKSK